MNIGVAISQSIRYSIGARKTIKIAVLLVFAVLVVMAVPVFAAAADTPTYLDSAGCNKNCQNKGYEYGYCSAEGTYNQYYQGRQIINGNPTEERCKSRDTTGYCNCINTDTKYLSENNLALTSVVDTWCKYSVQGGSGYYTLSITYLSLGLNSFTVQDSVSGSATRMFSGLQQDVKQLSRTQVEAGRPGPDYDIIVTWRPPASISNYLWGQPNSNSLSSYNRLNNQEQTIRVNCQGPSRSGGLTVPAIEGAKEIGIKDVRCAGKELPNKWNLVDLDESTGESVSGSCDLLFDNTYDINGIMIAGQPGIGISSITLGSKKYDVNETISGAGKIFVPIPQEAGKPVKAGSVKVNFKNTGTVTEINPFPDTAILDLALSTKDLTIGGSVVIEGNATRRVYAATGQYAVCRSNIETACVPKDASDLYVIPLPVTIYNKLRDISIGFPMWGGDKPWINIDNTLQLVLLGAGIVGMSVFSSSGDKQGKIDMIKILLTGGLVYYTAKDARDHKAEECVPITIKDKTGNEKIQLKCKFRIAFIPWFSYTVAPDPGPQYYSFDYDSCNRPSFTDLMSVNLPLYLAFGEYWNQAEDKYKTETDERIDRAFNLVSSCESCLKKGSDISGRLYCNDVNLDGVYKYKDGAIDKYVVYEKNSLIYTTIDETYITANYSDKTITTVNTVPTDPNIACAQYSPFCEWNTATNKCIPVSSKGKWCAKSVDVTISGQSTTYYYGDTTGTNGICMQEGESCPSGKSAITKLTNSGKCSSDGTKEDVLPSTDISKLQNEGRCNQYNTDQDGCLKKDDGKNCKFCMKQDNLGDSKCIASSGSCEQGYIDMTSSAGTECSELEIQNCKTISGSCFWCGGYVEACWPNANKRACSEPDNSRLLEKDQVCSDRFNKENQQVSGICTDYENKDIVTWPENGYISGICKSNLDCAVVCGASNSVGDLTIVDNAKDCVENTNIGQTAGGKQCCKPNAYGTIVVQISDWKPGSDETPDSLAIKLGDSQQNINKNNNKAEVVFNNLGLGSYTITIEGGKNTITRTNIILSTNDEIETIIIPFKDIAKAPADISYIFDIEVKDAKSGDLIPGARISLECGTVDYLKDGKTTMVLEGGMIENTYTTSNPNDICIATAYEITSNNKNYKKIMQNKKVSDIGSVWTIEMTRIQIPAPTAQLSPATASPSGTIYSGSVTADTGISYQSSPSPAFVTQTGEENIITKQSEENIMTESVPDSVIGITTTAAANDEVFASKCNNAVKNGRYFCVDSSIVIDTLNVKGVGVYNKALGNELYLGNGIYCAYPYVTGRESCDALGNLLDNYYKYDYNSYGGIDLCNDEPELTDRLNKLGIVQNKCNILSDSIMTKLQSNSVIAEIDSAKLEELEKEINSADSEQSSKSGILSTTGDATGDYVTGMSSDYGGGGADSGSGTGSSKQDNKQLVLQLSQMLVRKEKMMQAARAGAGYYYREWKTKPGLAPVCGDSDTLLKGYNYRPLTGSSGQTPTITANAVSGASSNLVDYGTGGVGGIGGSAYRGISVVDLQAGNYHTTEGEITQVNRTVYITITNSTNSTPMDCIIGNNNTGQLCKDIPVQTDEKGYFKYFYRPMINGTYNVSAKVHTNAGDINDKTSGLVVEKHDIFKVQPFSIPEIYFQKNESCTLPASAHNFTPALTDLAKFPIVIKNPSNITLAYVSYNFNITQEPDQKYGDAGFEYYNESGDLVLVNNISYNLAPGETIIVNLTSGMILPETTDIRTYYITAVVSNTTYNVSKEFQFNHTVFLKTPAILNMVTEPSLRPFDIRPETYFIRITSPMPLHCGFTDYKLLKEVPKLWSGSVEIDGETDFVRLNATESVEARFILSPNPNEIEIGKRYESNLIVTEKLPDEIGALKGSTDLLGIDVDPRMLYIVTDSRIIFVNKTDFKTISYEANGGQSIAADAGPGGNIYWSEDDEAEGRILCSSKLRFSPNRLANNIGPAKLAVTYNYLYFTQEDGIYRVIKNCIAEQKPEKVYSLSTGQIAGSGQSGEIAKSETDSVIITGSSQTEKPVIIDISADRDVIYWLEMNGTKTAVKSVGETQIGSSGATDVYTLAERDASLLYILKGSGRIGDMGRFGVFYATNSSTARIAKLGSQRDYIVIGGEGAEKIVSEPVDMVLDNDTIFWIQNGIKRISKNNLANYISMYYEYTPDAPLITINPMNASLSLDEERYFTVNITNKAFVDVDYQIFVEGITEHWYTDMDIIETIFMPKETKSYTFILRPNKTVEENKTYSICIRAKNTRIWPNSDTASLFSRCVGVEIGKRALPEITLSIIDAMRTENNKAVTLPERTVWYNVIAKNMDKSDFSISAFRLAATVPLKWAQSFETNILNIMPLETKTVKLKITPVQDANDGEYEIRVDAENTLDSSARSSAIANIIIDLCGNGICNLERGEDNGKCPADCPNPGYNNFIGVYNVPRWTGLLQHDYNGSNSVNFSTQLGLSMDRSLQQQKILFCRQSASPQECKQSDCGLGKQCLAAKSLQQQESIPTLNMRCPTDSTEAYYMLYTGRTINSPDRDYISPNYTYSCPFYNTTALLSIKATMEEKTTLCQQVLFNYNNSVFRPAAGKTREDCVNAWSKICAMEDNFLKYLNLVLDPEVISIEKTGYTFELYSKLKNQGWFADNSQCEGVTALFIEDVRIN
ncbi:MAG: hypothetical protein HZB65_05130 [Candidatus Aenigmarchaeota archaeon]|nr:hypothetical protein [Candidatus Aenigmarchaeota archaeon]